jgi:hypothetical protein
MGGSQDAVSLAVNLLLVGWQAEPEHSIADELTAAGLAVVALTDVDDALRHLTTSRLELHPVQVVLVGEAVGATEQSRLLHHAAKLRSPPHIWIAGGQHGAAVTTAAALAGGGPPAAQSTATPATTLIRPIVQSLVGRLPWKQIQALLRTAVVREALARTHGSRRSAARMLGLSRTAVQRIIRESDLGESPGDSGHLDSA